jgi:diadenosine tetraphosphate (Ap4A) HIT family hydrolase
VCPFCALVAGGSGTVLLASDVIAETDRALAFISPRWWEPDGNQDVWHLHAHVFPRHDGDRLYEVAPIDGFADWDRRAAFAGRLRPLLADEAKPRL